MLFITLAKLRGVCISLSGLWSFFSHSLLQTRSIQSAETQRGRGWAGDGLALGLLLELSKTILQKHFWNTVDVLRYVVYIFSMRDLEVVFTY